MTTKSGATTLYRLYDIKGRLLYVGISEHGFGRLRAHEKDKDWWLLVAHAEFTHFQTRDDALAQEAYMIERYHPAFNKAGNPNPGAIEEFAPLLRQVAPEVLVELLGMKAARHPKPCQNCQRTLGARLKKGRCPACYRYLQRNQRERPVTPEVGNPQSEAATP